MLLCKNVTSLEKKIPKDIPSSKWESNKKKESLHDEKI